MKLVVDFQSTMSKENLSLDVKSVRDRFLNKAGKDIQIRAMEHHRFNSRSGRLLGAISYAVHGDQVEISVDTSKAPYAPFIHDGTGIWGPTRRAYAIFPREHMALAFDGRFARKVVHQGIQADPFLFAAADSEQDKLTEWFASELVDTLGG